MAAVALAEPTHTPRIAIALDRVTAQPDALEGCMGTDAVGCSALFDAIGLTGGGQTLFVEAR